jgi:chemotaxis protein CheD
MSHQHRISPGSLLRRREDCMEHVPVRIGEVKVAASPGVLYTIGLGSCVAVALYDPASGIGGLAHAMLPDPRSGRQGAPPGRFATTAVPALVALMEENGAVAERIRARLAGGAAMFRSVLEDDGLRLGERNVAAARAALVDAGIGVVGEDVFGTYGRSVLLNTADGRLVVTSVEHADVVL